MVKLVWLIDELSKKLQRPLRVLDIGVGDGRIIKGLVGLNEVWEQIASYVGIDNAKTALEMADEAKTLAPEKVALLHMDAVDLATFETKVDLAICTWFTAGNFIPSGFNFETFDGTFDLTHNDTFTRVFNGAYGVLDENGEIFIGSYYNNTNKTLKKQETTYRHFGWKVITDDRVSFTANEKGWWSQRFTREQIKRYLPEIEPNKFHFEALDPYGYAEMVRIKK